MVKHPSVSNHINVNDMKRRLIIALVLILSLFDLSAQDFKPTTTWPYLYSDFTEGEIQKYGGTSSKGVYNVHLAKGTLHFVENGMIREALASEVFSVKIGQDYFANVGGTIMKVLARSDNGFIAQETLADFAALNNTGGAYGSSSNSISTQALSSLEGIGGTRTNMNHMELKNSKEDGAVLPVITKVYLVLPRQVVFATKKDVSDIDGIDKKALGAFLKEKKVKWKNPQDLLVVLDYVAENIKD